MKKMKNLRVFFSPPLALHYFGFAEVRLRLGRPKLKTCGVSFCPSLALHYLCIKEYPFSAFHNNNEMNVCRDDRRSFLCVKS